MAMEQNPIQQLEEAAATVPPDVALARIAMINAHEYMVQSKDKATTSAHISEALGQFVAVLAAEEPTRPEAVQEFTAHANTYSTLAEAFAGTSEQTEPTQTKGKQQSEGKR